MVCILDHELSTPHRWILIRAWASFETGIVDLRCLTTVRLKVFFHGWLHANCVGQLTPIKNVRCLLAQLTVIGTLFLQCRSRSYSGLPGLALQAKACNCRLAMLIPRIPFLRLRVRSSLRRRFIIRLAQTNSSDCFCIETTCLTSCRLGLHLGESMRVETRCAFARRLPLRKWAHTRAVRGLFINAILSPLSLEEHADVAMLPNFLLLTIPRPLIDGGGTGAHFKTAVAS